MTNPRSALMPVFVLSVLCAAQTRAQGVYQLQVSPERLRLLVGDRAAVVVNAYAVNGGTVAVPGVFWNSTDTTLVRVESDSAWPEVARLVALREGSAVV